MFTGHSLQLATCNYAMHSTSTWDAVGLSYASDSGRLQCSKRRGPLELTHGSGTAQVNRAPYTSSANWYQASLERQKRRPLLRLATANHHLAQPRISITFTIAGRSRIRGASPKGLINLDFMLHVSDSACWANLTQTYEPWKKAFFAELCAGPVDLEREILESRNYLIY